MQVVLSLGPGGTERLVIDLVRRLQSRFRMSVCCLDARGAWAPQVESLGVPLTACSRRSGFRPSLSGQIAELARREQVDVLHCHHYTPFVYGALAAWRSPRPALLFTEHGRLNDAPPSLKRRTVNRFLSRIPRRVYAVSRDLAGHVSAEGFATVDVVHNGIDPGPEPTPASRANARQALGLAADAFVVSTVARIDPVKDLGTLVRAFATATTDVTNAHLVIVGDGPDRGAVEQLARDAGVSDRVLITGVRGDARELLHAADVYVNSSITEGISLTILEAMAARLPVVATRVGGTPEIVADETCGLLVDRGDAVSIATAIRQLAGAPARRLAIGNAARARVCAKFGLDRMVETYAEAYEREGAR
jgi:L-malate glycosyltransferase